MCTAGAGTSVDLWDLWAAEGKAWVRRGRRGNGFQIWGAAQAGLEPHTACLSAYTLPGLGQPEPISGKAAGHLGVWEAEAGALFTTEIDFGLRQTQV